MCGEEEEKMRSKIQTHDECESMRGEEMRKL
jgi:hypothetical protein